MNPAAGSPFLRVKTPAFSHNSLAFSPFFEDRIAVASGSNFGLVGNGRVHILQLGPGGLQVVKWFDTQDCVYDVAWNESHENQVVAACGNGALRMFDIKLEGLPIKAWHEHTAEIMSVEWSNLQKETFVTASWDQTVKVWTTNRATSLLTIPAHPSQIFKASFSPAHPSLIASCGSDGTMNLFDIRAPTSPSSASPPAMSIKVAPDGSDVLDLDWNKYMPEMIATAGKDGVLRVWDTRAGSRAVEEFRGHRLAARKVAWSPHSRDVLSSTSYDMTCRIWQLGKGERQAHDQHTEFVMGTAWALFDEGLLASCAWDQEVHLFKA